MSFGFDRLVRDRERSPRFTFWDKDGCIIVSGFVLSPDGEGLGLDDRRALEGEVERLTELSDSGAAAVLSDLGTNPRDIVGGCYKLVNGRLRAVQS